MALLLASVCIAGQSDSGLRRASSYSRSLASYEIPDVMVVDMHGADIALRSLLNPEGPVLLQFIFTTCAAVCPVMSQIFSSAQHEFGPDLERIRMISISIDPEQDTPARLQDYARQLAAGPQWHFLTGRLVDIIAIEQAFDVDRGNKMRHEPLTFLRASQDEWLRFDGLMSPSELVAEYRRLIAR